MDIPVIMRGILFPQEEKNNVLVIVWSLLVEYLESRFSFVVRFMYLDPISLKTRILL